MAGESYTVQARLQMTSNVPEVIQQMMRGFSDVNRLIKETTDLLSQLSRRGNGVNKLADSMEKLGKVRLGSGLLTDLQEVSRYSRQLVDQQVEMARAARDTAKAWHEMANVRPPSSRGGSAHGRAGFSHGDLLDAGMGLQMGGNAGVGLAERGFMAQADVQRQTLLAQADTRVTDAVMQQVNAQIRSLQSRYPTLTQEEGIKLFRENQGIFGDSSEALAALPGTVRLQSLYQLTGLGHGGTGGDETQAANKAGDAMQSFINPATHKLDLDMYNQFMDLQARSALAGGGLVDAKSWLTFARSSRTSGIGLNRDALEYTQALLELSPSRTGTGLNSAFQVFGAGTGHMTKGNRAAWQQAGLVDKHGDLVDQKLYQSDPYQWVWNDMLPRLQKMGIKDRDGIIKWLTEHGQRATVAGILAEIAVGQTPIQNTKAKMDATNPDSVDTLMNSDIGKITQLHAAETNFLVSLGKFLEGPGIALMESFAKALNALSDWANAHPKTAGDIVLVGAGLAVLSKAVGDTALIVYMGAPVVRGFTALASAISPFSAGGRAAGAIETLAGGGGASLGALAASILGLGAAAAAAAALPSAFAWLNRQIGIPDTPEGRAAKNAANPSPHGNRLMDSLSNWWNDFSNAPAPSGHGGAARGAHQSSSGASADPISWVRPPGGSGGTLHADIVIDGRRVMRAIVPYMAQEIAYAPSGQANFDPRMTAMPTGAPVST
jgi:hypothetical protein